MVGDSVDSCYLFISQYVSVECMELMIIDPKIQWCHGSELVKTNHWTGIRKKSVGLLYKHRY